MIRSARTSHQTAHVIRWWPLPDYVVPVAEALIKDDFVSKLTCRLSRRPSHSAMEVIPDSSTLSDNLVNLNSFRYFDATVLHRRCCQTSIDDPGVDGQATGSRRATPPALPIWK